jgi:transcriptional regulator with XRE-family HTH domain
MADDALKGFGARLKQLRIAQGLNQSQFAKKVSLTQAAISQFEDGKRIPSSSALQKIASSLGLSLDELVGNSQEDVTDSEKDAAIQALISKLKRKSVNTEAIIALNRFMDAQTSNNEQSE